MTAAVLESIGEHVLCRSAECDRARAQVVEEGLVVFLWHDHLIEPAIPDERGTACGVQGINHGGPVAQEKEGLPLQTLAHGFAGAIPRHTRAPRAAAPPPPPSG